eukprot:9689166-Alexandrium_andersonii.AAC.1
MPASRRASGAPASRASTCCRCVFWSPAAAKNTGSVRAWTVPACPVITAANSPDHLSTGACRQARAAC